MIKLRSNAFVLVFTALTGLTFSPAALAQDVVSEEAASEDVLLDPIEAPQNVDPYDSYEQIKALGVIDPAAIPDPIESVVESLDPKETEIFDEDNIAKADILIDVSSAPEGDTLDVPDRDVELLDLSIVTLDDDAVVITESEPELAIEPTIDSGTFTDIEMSFGVEPQKAEEPMALPSLDKIANAVEAPRLARADILPFFLSAEEYLAARGDREVAQTSLIYEVITASVDAADIGSKSKTETVQLLIGPDYVARQSDRKDTEFRIYDFKFNRLLRILPPAKEGESANMINVSLFPLAHRHTRTIASMTGQGKKESVEAGPVTLDAFWIESAMSWAMNDRLENLETSRSDDGVEITYKDQSVFKVSFEKDPYLSSAQSDALLVFAHHNWPAHPSVLREFFAAPAPVNSMTILSKSPNAPKGAKQSWTLMSREDGQGAFPLPADAINLAAGPGTADPIAFVINAAARGTALGGRPTQDSAAADFTLALEAEDLTTAWLAGQRYAAIFGSCEERSEDSVCKGVAEIESRDDLPPSLTVLIKAFEDAKTPATRARALTALKVYANDPDAAPIILRLMGITRAKLGNATARAAGLESLDAQSLMKTALARDPYDPQTYLGLAQYNAARGDFEAAWDIYDTLRSSIDGRKSARFGVDKVEAALIERAPGYFELPVMVTPQR